MRTFLTLLALGALLLQQPPRYSVVQDGEAHGDPPYVLEEGWTPLLNGKDLSGWKACEADAKNEWYTTRFVRFERFLRPTQLNGRPAPSGVMLNGPTGRTASLCTERAFGDVELYLEFMLAKGSNSGVYLQGLYEIQIFDSWGSIESMTTSDAGAIYHRWIDNRGEGGSAPLANASRRPGEWQSYQVWFRAPRFDGPGRKTEPARFLRVLFNGRLVQKNADAEGPTRAHLSIPEAAQNPLMIQGDHGPVAFRNIYVRPLRELIVR
ncbi:MAG: 3-keto-disaccharide hydrolase [Vicinamibacterales bacterium]